MTFCLASQALQKAWSLVQHTFSPSLHPLAYLFSLQYSALDFPAFKALQAEESSSQVGFSPLQ
jgi:hypothetical protein